MFSKVTVAFYNTLLNFLYQNSKGFKKYTKVMDIDNIRNKIVGCILQKTELHLNYIIQARDTKKYVINIFHMLLALSRTPGTILLMIFHTYSNCCGNSFGSHPRQKKGINTQHIMLSFWHCHNSCAGAELSSDCRTRHWLTLNCNFHLLWILSE